MQNCAGVNVWECVGVICKPTRRPLLTTASYSTADGVNICSRGFGVRGVVRDSNGVKRIIKSKIEVNIFFSKNIKS